MQVMRLIATTSVMALAFGGIAAGSAAAASAAPQEASEQRYVVLFSEGTTSADARASVEAAGGTVVQINTQVGVATIVTDDAAFAERAARQSVIEGTAQNRVIGGLPSDQAAKQKMGNDAVEHETRATTEGSAARGKPRHPGKPIKGPEPLADLQWDMQQIDATVDGSYALERGDKKVLVGILDTGVDGSHPDIKPNFAKHLSRNFTVDIEADANGDPVDGPCADEPDHSCEDPADVDENGHGTHVASIIGSPINGLGVAGVAPEVTLVNLRAGQDSGYFFLQASVDALTYAGDKGIDVVNMSYYVDPWLFNCIDHPADSPADQAEQRTIITAMQRALDYAHRRDVTLVSSAGNGASDYTKTLTDASSPDFASVPGEVAYVRDLLNPDTCISMPSEGRGVISVSSTGISERKAYYSDYGNGYVDVAAPGGDVYDTADTNLDYKGGILAAYPAALAKVEGAIDENGDVVVPWAVKSCDVEGKTCAYYQYFQGTSMASPHAAGVAALIVSAYGKRNRGGLTLDSDKVERVLLESATAKACPDPAAYTYTRSLPNGSVVTTTHTCEGTEKSNGFYGEGIINALAAVSADRRH